MSGFDPNVVMPVVALLLVGAIAIRNLQAKVSDTPRGRWIVRGALAGLVLAAVVAVYGLVTRQRAAESLRPGGGELQQAALIAEIVRTAGEAKGQLTS